MGEPRSGSSAVPVILFKTPSPSSANDPYTVALSTPSTSRLSYRPTFVPVLEETYDIEHLVPIIAGGAAGWEGVVITSKRGAEGWVRAVRAFLEPRKSRKGKEKDTGRYEDVTFTLASQGTPSSERWASVPLFTVGTASSEHLSTSDLPPTFVPQIRSSAPPKSALYLLPEMLDAPPRHPHSRLSEPNPDLTAQVLDEDAGRHGKYLFVRGDKSMDYLPSQLTGRGREVVEVVVYQTTGREDVGRNLTSARTEVEARLNKSGGHGGADGRGWTPQQAEAAGWLAFFSPSGAKVVLPHLLSSNGPDNYTQPDGQHQRADSSQTTVTAVLGADRGVDTRKDARPTLGELHGQWGGWKIVTIGETTRKYLEDEQGIKVYAVADSPNPAGLLKAIHAVDEGLR